MGEQIEMSTAENIFGSVSNVLNQQNALRPTLRSILELWVKHLILHGHHLI